MKKFCVLLLLSLCLTGCKEMPKVAEVSPYTDSYIENVNKERNVLTGDVTLEPGEYIIYGEKPTEDANGNLNGTTVVKSDKGDIEVFGEKDYFRVSETVNITVSNGYILPLEEAVADNAEIENDGVYLVGFDIKQNIKLTNGDYIEVCDSIPELFQQPDTVLYKHWNTTTLEEGQLIRLIDSYAVTRPTWDVADRVEEFNSIWTDTSIDYKRGYKNDVEEEEYEVEFKDNQILEANYYVLLTSKKRDTIDIKLDLAELDVRAYYNHIWFEVSEHDTMSTNADYTWLCEIPESEMVATEDGYELVTQAFKVEKGKYTTIAYSKPSLNNALNGIYLVGVDIPAGQYRIKSGYLYTLSGAPYLSDYLDFTQRLESAPYYTDDYVITLLSGDFIVADKLKIVKDTSK